MAEGSAIYYSRIENDSETPSAPGGKIKRKGKKMSIEELKSLGKDAYEKYLREGGY